MIFLISLIITICTIVHMWKRVDLTPIVKVLISLAFMIIPFACLAWWIYFLIKKPAVLSQYTTENGECGATNPNKSSNTSQSNASKSNEKRFVLNRWISKLADWFDGGVFEMAQKEGYAESSPICVWAFWIGILTGGSIAVATMINDQSTYPVWAASIGGGIILAMVAVYAIKDIKLLQTGGQIAGRLAYLVFVPLLLALVGGILAAMAVVIVAIILFLWFLLTLLFGTNEKVKLSNGDVVRNDGVLLGWRGKSGDKYSQNLDGTFSPDND